MSNGKIGFRVRTLNVCTNTDQIAGLLITGISLFKPLGPSKMLGFCCLWHNPTDGSFNVDGGVVALFRKPSGQHNVTVQYRPGCICNGVLLIVAFGQYGIKCSNGAASG